MASADPKLGRVLFVQTVIPDYRARFFEDLSRRVGPRLLLVSGEEDWQPDVRHSLAVSHVMVRNVFLFRRRTLWQAGVVRRALAAEIVVLPLNPRIITNWIVLVTRRILRRRTIVWGHAWPRKGSGHATDRVRAVMRRLASTVVAYTETEAMELRSVLSDRAVVAAPNALYRQRELKHRVVADEATDLVCVGRLTPSKKPGLLLDAFSEARARLPSVIRLVFVGNGPLRERLQGRIHSLGLDERVVLTGHISSVDQLRDVYSNAIASVSAGDVGLSLIQSLGFGVPMILPRDADHGPEIEAAAEGANAIFFDRDSASALASAICDVVQERRVWLSRRAEIAAPILEHNTIEIMVDSFLEALALDASTGQVSGVGRPQSSQGL